ncbi:hypothetical protein LWF01_02270 [Saxibacter everestensis]|uniref:PspA-associated domain-containing protein n=1 Tax=Saxibacter everestensis TaxID=2909229 RepID=A0ABY8QW58_9MICO|nr:hypothetical protein LWF01_02270 [Brevibacteriaceae bacterium ZFBP1038]
MIIRVLGEGQFQVPDADLPEIQKFDEQLDTAVQSGDQAAISRALTQLREHLVTVSHPVEDDYLGSSDIVVPYPDASVEEVRQLLNADGLIPGTS